MKADDPLITEALAEDPHVQAIEAELEAWYAAHPEEGDDFDRLPNANELYDEIAALKRRRIAVYSNARARHMAFWETLRPGALFAHKRYITADRTPELCKVTKVTYCRHGAPDMVFYRVGVADDRIGLATKSSPEYFRREAWGMWVAP